MWTSAEPPRPASHPDLVLAEAVAEGVLTVIEAELVGETRVGGVALGELAARWGLSYQAAKMDLPPGGGHRGYAATGDGSGLLVACWCSHSMGGR